MGGEVMPHGGFPGIDPGDGSFSGWKQLRPLGRFVNMVERCCQPTAGLSTDAATRGALPRR